MSEKDKMRKKIVPLVVIILMVLVAAGATVTVSAVKPTPTLLDPTTIPKYVNQLTGPPPVYVPTSDNNYEVTVSEKPQPQQILPAPLPTTNVWGYGGTAKDAVTGQSLGFVQNAPGPSFEVTKGSAINVKWINNLNGPQMFAVDPPFTGLIPMA